MQDVKISIDLEKYLNHVDRYLKYLPISEKTDILSELKSSFYERLISGQSSEEIIAKMPTAKDLAGNYIDDAFVKTNKLSFKTLCKYILFFFILFINLASYYTNAFHTSYWFVLIGNSLFCSWYNGIIKRIY